MYPPLFNEIPDPILKVYPKREYKAKSKVKPFSNPNFIKCSQINKTFGGDRPESFLF